MEFLLFLAVIALAVIARAAHIKISRLETQVQQLLQGKSETNADSAQAVDQSVAQPPAVNFSPAPIPAPTYSSNQTPKSGEPSPIPRSVPLHRESVGPAQPFFLYTWFKDHTLIKVGSIIFFFGAAWFVSYAFEQNWISPLLRVCMGLALAGVVYVVGYARRPVEMLQYIVLTALGSAIVFATVLAAQFSFTNPLLPAAASLLLLLVTIAYTLWVSFQTNTQWLAITAAIAALLAPQFTGSDPSSAVPFLSYLFVVAAGFGVVVLATAWRYVSLTLVLGVSVYLLSISTLPEQGKVIWFFALLFSGLFLGLTTSSVMRNRIPLFIDGLTLLVTGLLFIYFVHTLAVIPELAAFIAAIVTALIGYGARLRSVDPAAVLLYAGISVVSIFAGTAYLFDGFTATFFFAMESAVLVFFAMRYAFLKRTILLASTTLLVPLVLGVVALADSAWDTGIIHAPALAVLAVSVCLCSVGVYMYIVARQHTLDWLTTLAQATLVSWYGFTTIMLLVVARALAALTASTVLSWSLVLLLLLSILITAVTLTSNQLRQISLWTYTLPVIAGSGVLIQAGVQGFFTRTEILVCSILLSSLLVVMVVFGLYAKANQSTKDALASYIFLWMSFLFASAWMLILVGTLLYFDSALTLGVTLVALLTYGVINGLLRLDLQFDRIAPFIIVLLTLGVGMLPAVSLQGWEGGVMSIEAIGMYAYVTLILLTGVTLYQYATQWQNDKARLLASVLFIVGGLFSFALVWILTHTISSTVAIAVTAALFVYTIAGLFAYVYGKRDNQPMFVRAGQLLLTAVVLRLALIDVWNMDPFWRIITFLGIGALFIVAALLEQTSKEAVEEHGTE